MPILRALSSVRSRDLRIGCPSKNTVPELGGSSPAIIFTRVDLPLPLGPITAACSPLSRQSETPFRALICSGRSFAGDHAIRPAGLFALNTVQQSEVFLAS